MIVNKAKINEDPKDTMIRSLKEEKERLLFPPNFKFYPIHSFQYLALTMIRFYPFLEQPMNLYKRRRFIFNSFRYFIMNERLT